MRAVSAVMLLLVAGVEGTYDCTGPLVDWKVHPSTYISCNAKGHSEPGSLEEQKRLCIELEDACSGITCNDGTGSCTVRHHHDGSSECTEHKFLETSPGETSYTKSCLNCRWQEVRNYYIPCYAKEPVGGEDISLTGPLLERQIECHELGADCIGVTCADHPDNMHCSVRDHRACDEGTQQLMPGEGEVSYIKLCGEKEPPRNDVTIDGTLPPETPPADDCAWSTFVETDLTCRDIVGDQAGPLTTKKYQCERMGRDCAGISCDVTVGLDSCHLHEHVGCVGKNGYLETKKGMMTFLKSCRGGGGVCEHPCYYHEETDHKCKTNCDCSGYRWCNQYGWCDGGNAEKMVHEKVCLNGTSKTCSFSKVENHYISCFVGVPEEMSLFDAERRCVEMNSECMGVTCSRDNKCSVRHHAQCADGNYLEQSLQGETSYTKACGHSAVKRDGEGEDAVTLYLVYTIVLLSLLIILLIAIIFRNRMNVRTFAQGIGYGEVVQHEEMDEDIEEPVST